MYNVNSMHSSKINITRFNYPPPFGIDVMMLSSFAWFAVNEIPGPSLGLITTTSVIGYLLSKVQTCSNNIKTS